MSENKKTENLSAEIKDDELEKVAGGASVPYVPSTHCVSGWAWAKCTSCGEDFAYEYSWHWGLENHGAGHAPEKCPKCDPATAAEIGGR